jgi:RNA polymerase sigma factor (TIGR02999 family)
MSEITRVINAIHGGDPETAAKLFPLVYDELRRMARASMAQERVGHTLQATALVHEAFVRLWNDKPASWDGRRHFFGAAAEAMRRILVEHARARGAIKRGAGRKRVSLGRAQTILEGCDSELDDLLALNDALDRLAAEDPAKADLVKLLYFAGLNLDEAAAVLGLSRTTAYRQWLYARAWLRDAMG